MNRAVRGRDLDPDAIWRSAGMTWESFGQANGMTGGAANHAALKMGFRRDSDGKFAEAPCRRCGNPTPADRLDTHRLCIGCRILSDPSVERYHLERARRQPMEYWHLLTRGLDQRRGWEWLRDHAGA